MDPTINKATSFSENEIISLSTTPESDFVNHTVGTCLNEHQGTISLKDDIQQLKDQVATLQAEQRKKAQRYQKQRKTSYFLRKKMKDRENKIEKILKENEELRIENKETRNHLKCLEQRVQNIEWDVEGTKQGFKKDIKDLQGKVQTSEWALEEINRNLENVIDDVEEHTGKIDSIERALEPEDV